jgi:hypothetical protein
MKNKLTAPWAATPSSQRREPTLLEVSNGFPCGPADQQLFNELMFRLSQIEAEAIAVLTAAGVTPSESDLTQMLASVRRLPNAGPYNRAVVSVTTTAPPGSPTLNATYVVPTGATGAWAAQVGNFAFWDGSAWSFATPLDGVVVRASDTGGWHRVESAAWVSAYAGTTSDDAGVVTLADTTTAQVITNSVNPLTPATLPYALRGSTKVPNIFTASGTWTKPVSPRFWGVDVVVIGGGGSGGVSTSGTATPFFGGGGSSGALIEHFYPASDLSLSSYAVTVGCVWIRASRWQ